MAMPSNAPGEVVGGAEPVLSPDLPPGSHELAQQEDQEEDIHGDDAEEHVDKPISRPTAERSG